MRILVTGVSGFIGTNLAHALRDSGNEVAGIDIRSPSYLDKEICVIEHDLRTPLPTQMLHGVDAVIALAADMGGMGRISRNKGTLMRNNTLIDVNTFEAARNADVRTVVFASSACVYPNFLQVTRGRNLRESDAFPADPQDAYGLAKLYSEQLLAEFASEYGFEHRIARLHNVFGPLGDYEGGREKAPAAICRRVAMAVPGAEIDVWGDGSQTRTFLYIDDCVDALLRLMTSSLSQPVNVGSSRLITVNELAQSVIRASGKQGLRIRNTAGPQGVRSRGCNNSLAMTTLGWSPSTTLESGLAKTYNWIASQLGHSSGATASRMERESTID